MTAPARRRSPRAIDNTTARLQSFLDLGRWPSGVELTEEDRRIIRWNLELARRERRELDAHA